MRPPTHSGARSPRPFGGTISPCAYTGAATPPPGQPLTPQPAGNAVTMTPSPCVGWTFSHWEYKNANGQWVVHNPPFGNNVTVHMNWWPGTGIRIPEGETTFDVKAVFGGGCGNGTMGLNLNRASIATGFFAGIDTKAVAWQESRWRQFTCARQVLKNGNATGMMQIIPSQWPDGFNSEVQRNIESGDLCSGTGYHGNQAYNRQLGEDIFQLRMTQSLNIIGQYSPTAEQLLKEAAAKYYGGNEVAYWNRNELRNNTPPEWIPNTGAHVTHANSVWGHRQAQTWNAHLNCPCD